MSSVLIASITFVCVFAGVLLGTYLRKLLPEHHLKDDSRDVLKMGTGLIGTLTALVLGLLISSAKSSFDSLSNGLYQTGAKIIMLDHVLARYGPGANDARDMLRRCIGTVILHGWPEDKAAVKGLDSLEPVAVSEGLDCIHNALLRLPSQDDAQRALQAQALQVANELGQMRWQLIEQSESSLPTPFIVVLIFWLSVLFASFGMFARPNVTNISVLILCALSMACAIFLLVEMTHPTTGFMKVSSAPLVKAFELLGK